jgi:nucleotide-binding universal stress UspA family protein
VDADVLILDGEAPKMIAAAAKEKSAGLVVMSRTSASGTTGKLGSRAYGVICYAPCPVVSI